MACLTLVCLGHLSAQTKYVFLGTNSALIADDMNWQGGLSPCISASSCTIAALDSVEIRNQAVISTSGILTNNGVITIGDVNNFTSLSFLEVGTFNNNGVLIITENAVVSTDEGGRIVMNSGSRTELSGSLSKQEFGSLILNSGFTLNINGNGLLEIF